MGLRSLLASGINGSTSRLKPSWSYKAKGKDSVIWKLLISPEGILTGEERNIEAKTSSLFALNVEGGKTLWKEKKLEEEWWFGSEIATRHNIYVHTYIKPDMPEPRGIIAVDIETGAVRWRQPDYVLLFEANEKVFASRPRFRGRDIVILDLLSGVVLETLEENAQTLETLRELFTEDDTASVYATALSPESELFRPIAEMLEGLLDVKEVRGTIDFAEFGRYVIFSYHDRLQSAEAMLNNLLKNELRVLDRESGEIVFREVLNAETPFPVPDNFFINRGTLIYVKDKQEIKGVQLL